MDSGQLLSDATTLMVLGMGTVFVFLTVLVYITSFMSMLVRRFAAEPPAAGNQSVPPLQSADDQTLVAVISAAIHAHRSRK